MEIDLNVPIVVVLAAFFAAALILGRRKLRRRAEHSQTDHGRRRQRAEESQAVAHHHGWRWSEANDDYLATLTGEPFERGSDRTATNVIAGTHRERTFVSFEYTYSTPGRDKHGHPYTRIEHASVLVTTLPTPVPGVEVRAEGLVGGRVDEGLGFDDIETGNASFDRIFRISGDDDGFTRAVMGPEMVDLLLTLRPEWAWRFSSDLMIVYQDGASRPAELPSRLDTAADLLDAVPATVWARHGSAEYAIP